MLQGQEKLLTYQVTEATENLTAAEAKVAEYTATAAGLVKEIKALTDRISSTEKSQKKSEKACASEITCIQNSVNTLEKVMRVATEIGLGRSKAALFVQTSMQRIRAHAAAGKDIRSTLAAVSKSERQGEASRLLRQLGAKTHSYQLLQLGEGLRSTTSTKGFRNVISSLESIVQK